MRRRLRAALTSRSTVLLLLLALIAAATVAAIVPQRGMDAAKGPGPGVATPSAPGLVVGALGLDHVFSTPWFATLALIFVASLSLSCLDQLRLARARMSQAPSEWEGRLADSRLDVAAVEGILRSEGYRRLSGGGGRSRHVRWWQGYWGNFLLHVGMTLTVLSSVTYVLTEHRATVHLIAGRPEELTPGGMMARRGLLARDLPLPAEVTLLEVVPEFGANDQLVDLASNLIFTDRGRGSREVQVAVNDLRGYEGLTVYQLLKYGHAFFLEIDTGDEAPVEMVVEMPFPEKRGTASYSPDASAGGKVLKAKYYASADRTRLVSDDPQLVLRLQDGEQVLAEATLQDGREVRLGPWSVRLARVRWWTEILFEGSLGTTGIFTGFAVLLLGAALVFFAVPREVVVSAEPGGCTVRWRATRFPDMFRDEGERVLSRCAGGRPQ